MALPEAGPELAAPARLAPWSAVLMLVAAVSVALAAFLESWPLALIAAASGVLGVGFLAFTAAKSGRQDARRL